MEYNIAGIILLSYQGAVHGGEVIVRVADIPPEGRTVEFQLDAEQLNSVASQAEQMARGSSFISPHYHFFGVLPASLRINVEGSTVLVDGRFQLQFATLCSRCAEETVCSLEVPVRLVLKPSSERAQVGEQDADLSTGYYRDEQINCAEIVQDFVMLAIPYAVVCRNDCKGLCQTCGKNLNLSPCECARRENLGSPFSILKQLLH